jgi:hypothetical protein
MAISLTVIDAYDYEPSVKAINKTLDTLGDKITKLYWFSDIDYPGEKRVETQWIKINRMTNYNDDYGYITLKLVPHIVQEEHNLIIHADGFAVNADAWTDEFLEYDYIGAAWQDGRIGNGGFCLRSRKLYDALMKLDVGYKTEHYSHIVDNPDYHIIDNGIYKIPEDNVICKIYRNSLVTGFGIKFAPLDLANQFSVERFPTHRLGRSLGFHGKHGIAQHYGVEL